MRKSQRIPQLAHWLIALGLLFGLQAAATAQESDQKPAKSAHEFATEVKDELLEVIRSKAALEQEGGTGKYIDAVKDVLEPVVDFDYIARGVMGRYGKQASDEQRRQFAEKFKQSLVNTYAKGLAPYGDYDITVVPPEGSVSGERTVGVWLNVSKGDVTHRLAFTTKLNRSGQWKVTNMILNGINLGQAFRGQFENAVKQNDGDIAAVIDNWAV